MISTPSYPTQVNGNVNPVRMRKGFTLVEVMIVVIMLSIMMVASIKFLMDNQQTYVSMLVSSTTEHEGRRILQNITEQVRNLGHSTFTTKPVDPGLNEIAAKEILSYDSATSTITYDTEAVTIGTQYSTGESDNGVDDNGNGLIDEMDVYLKKGTETSIFATHIMENGLTFTLSQSTGRATALLKVEVQTQMFDPIQQYTHSSTLTSTIQMYP
jgi:prepilin-type N-terminal cleavage/methylation domain-containing protein